MDWTSDWLHSLPGNLHFKAVPNSMFAVVFLFFCALFSFKPCSKVDSRKCPDKLKVHDMLTYWYKTDIFGFAFFQAGTGRGDLHNSTGWAYWSYSCWLETESYNGLWLWWWIRANLKQQGPNIHKFRQFYLNCFIEITEFVMLEKLLQRFFLFYQFVMVSQIIHILHTVRAAQGVCIVLFTQLKIKSIKK